MTASSGTPWFALHRRWLSWGLVAKLGSLAGLVATLVGLYFTFFPRDGGDKPAGKIEVANVNDRATLREYLVAERLPAGSLSDSILGRVGVLTMVRYSSTGLRGKKLLLDVALTSRAGTLACEHQYPIDAGSGAQLTFRVWTPFPANAASADSYDLHVTLFPPSGASPSLDAADRDGIAAPPAGSTAPLPIDVC